ncbi:MAG TPA: hypothetical protein VM661_13855 [Candidatus Sulfotelmatobacter sp.]|jgi:hypothetical protein|nr:hypothetical protein [Candidatus Sulfotelmatobacter sp.]
MVVPFPREFAPPVGDGADVTHRLFFGKAPDDFDPTTDFAIGTWCFAGAESRLNTWRHISFTAPFCDEADRLQQVQLCDHLYKWVLEQQAAEFVERHPQLPLTYWRYLLGPWVQYSVYQAWSRYRVLERFFASHADIALVAEVIDPDSTFSIATMEEIAPVFLSPFFIHWQASRFVEAMAPENVTLVHITDVKPDWSGTSEPPPPKSSHLRDWLGQAIDPVPGTRGWQRILLAMVLWCRGRSRRSRNLPSDGSAWNPKQHFPEPFLRVLPTLLASLCPANFDRLPAAVTVGRPWLRIRTPDYMSTAKRRENAISVAAGVRLVETQHGSHYGTALPFCIGAAFEYSADAFITWGWMRHAPYVGRFVPLPSPHLSHLRNRHRETKRVAIVVGTRISTSYDGFLWPSIGGTALRYLDGKEALLSHLRQNDIPLAYRPFLFDKETALFEEYLSRSMPDLTLVSGRLWDHALGCRLLVLDHYSTPLHEALVANVPTICIWSTQCPEISVDARPVFERLRACGIIYDDPIEAAIAVVRIWPDVEAWWRSPLVQEARAEFCRLHARTSRAWLPIWLLWLARL